MTRSSQHVCQGSLDLAPNGSNALASRAAATAAARCCAATAAVWCGHATIVVVTVISRCEAVLLSWPALWVHIYVRQAGPIKHLVTILINAETIIIVICSGL